MREVRALGALLARSMALTARHQLRQVPRERGVRQLLRRTLLPGAKLLRKRRMARLPKS